MKTSLTLFALSFTMLNSYAQYTGDPLDGSLPPKKESVNGPVVKKDIPATSDPGSVKAVKPADLTLRKASQDEVISFNEADTVGANGRGSNDSLRPAPERKLKQEPWIDLTYVAPKFKPEKIKHVIEVCAYGVDEKTQTCVIKEPGKKARPLQKLTLKMPTPSDYTRNHNKFMLGLESVHTGQQHPLTDSRFHGGVTADLEMSLRRNKNGVKILAPRLNTKLLTKDGQSSEIEWELGGISLVEYHDGNLDKSKRFRLLSLNPVTVSKRESGLSADKTQKLYETRVGPNANLAELKFDSKAYSIDAKIGYSILFSELRDDQENPISNKLVSTINANLDAIAFIYGDRDRGAYYIGVSIDSVEQIGRDARENKFKASLKLGKTILSTPNGVAVDAGIVGYSNYELNAHDGDRGTGKYPGIGAYFKVGPSFGQPSNTKQ